MPRFQGFIASHVNREVMSCSPTMSQVVDLFWSGMFRLTVVSADTVSRTVAKFTSRTRSRGCESGLLPRCHLKTTGHKSVKCEPVWPCIVQELCESRGGRPGLSVLTSLLVSVDVKIC